MFIVIEAWIKNTVDCPALNGMAVCSIPFESSYRGSTSFLPQVLALLPSPKGKKSAKLPANYGDTITREILKSLRLANRIDDGAITIRSLSRRTKLVENVSLS